MTTLTCKLNFCLIGVHILTWFLVLKTPRGPVPTVLQWGYSKLCRSVRYTAQWPGHPSKHGGCIGEGLPWQPTLLHMSRYQNVAFSCIFLSTLCPSSKAIPCTGSDHSQMSAPHHLERLFFLGLGHFLLVSSIWSLTPDQRDLGGPWSCWQRSRAKAAMVRVNHKLDSLWICQRQRPLSCSQETILIT